ncbi:putative late blight resistance protein homolog R1B-14 [Andrographis paniculata]|uniref:putative late blight resistance protein homolog R1B-14 n=1 Tax=Andrographis paniculata TaxID=175694 RepID=UPI0021E7D2FE|nr:putative late blight resistance protein homolog R1B-14 [Andrographis paniculata]
MAVAAYASLVSLTHVLKNLHGRARLNLPRADIKQVEALQENVNLLLEFVELHSERKSPELQGLWRQMAEAAAEAESAINFHVSNLLYARSQGETSDDAGFSDFCEEMEALSQNFHSIKKELPIQEEGEDAQTQKQPNAFVLAAGSSAASSYVSNVVVGLDDHVDRIRDKLIRGGSNFQILPIVGMGGIGKTTVAKSVFDDSFIVDHFDLRIWLSISQEYSSEQILKVGLQEKAGENEICESLDELGTRFYRRLYSRRYLIVMDDMWTSGAWDELWRYFPDNMNGSRMLCTTRLSHMAASLGSYEPYMLSFLSENESWTLFCENAFSQRGCPYEHLERIAKGIAKSCRGLPLEIVVIGRLLANSDMTVKYWENIEKNISALANLVDDEHCMKVLNLSYKSLPIHLKPCFLFMRIFREDEWIDISHLIDLWIAEGFIKQVDHTSLENIAKEQVKSLIDRNLIFGRGINGCGIHDLLRDLTLRESDNEFFFRFPRLQTLGGWFDKEIQCNHCDKQVKDKEGIDVRKPFYVFGSSSQVNCLVCDTCKMMYSHIKRPSLVSIANYGDGTEKDDFLSIELRHVNLHVVKLLAPSTLQLLWNLQSLRIFSTSSLVVLPVEIWEMTQLRDIISIFDVVLPNPRRDCVVLNGLHTIQGVYNFMCTKDIIDRIPNLNNLVLSYGYESEKSKQDWNLKKQNVHYKDGSEVGEKQMNYSLYNLKQLQKLESLSISNCWENISFPNSLKHLTLASCRMKWEDMPIVGSLLSLESLVIIDCVQGSVWEPVDGEFRRVKVLIIQYNNLVCWRADAMHFPVLEQLELRNLPLLQEIPSGIGDIPTLQSIILERCSDSVIHSAKEIWDEQQEVSNEIRIDVIGTVSYQIDAFIARITSAACESLAYFKCLYDNLKLVAQRGRHSLCTKQMKVVQEDIQFLQNFYKVFHPSKSLEMESLSNEIALAAHKAKVVIRRLRLEALLPILGKNTRDDVQRLLEKIVFIKKALAMSEAEEEKEEQGGYDTPCDIEKLRIFKSISVTDDDLREYQIGSITATMTESASLIWCDTACVLEVLRKAFDLGRHHLNNTQRENVEESICLLQEVVEVHSERKIQEIRSHYHEETGPFLAVAEYMNSKHLWRRSLEDAAYEDLLLFSRDLEQVIETLEQIK